MTELAACYFCGEVGESLERVAVMPDHLAPGADERLSVVLCPTCKEKLGSVIDPLVDSLEAAGDQPDAGVTGSAGGITFGSDTGNARAASEPDDGADATTDVDGERSDATSDETTSPTATRPATEASGDGDETAAGSDDGVSFDHEVSGSGLRSPADPGSESDAGSGFSVGGDSSQSRAASGDAPESESGTPAGDAGTSSSEDSPPPGYRSVIRLFRNRDRPVPRNEAELLAANAYDLDEADCRRILDAAIDAGDLVESSEGLSIAE